MTKEIVNEAFPDRGLWLPIDPPGNELRWDDGVHLDERSALIVTTSIQALTSSADVKQFTESRHLRREILNVRIADKVWSAFIRSEYDVAVFQAMKAVEVAVREASGLGAEDLGVNLMRKAFNIENGPLTDINAEKGERQARSDLFAGAMGSYKNSHSHRDVHLNNPDEAYELVMLANHLLRIVDQRRVASPPNS